MKQVPLFERIQDERLAQIDQRIAAQHEEQRAERQRALMALLLRGAQAEDGGEGVDPDREDLGELEQRPNPERDAAAEVAARDCVHLVVAAGGWRTVCGLYRLVAAPLSTAGCSQAELRVDGGVAAIHWTTDPHGVGCAGCRPTIGAS